MIRNVTKEDGAVSPVIGVILLVAVTVALVALATVIVFDIGDSVSDTADATVQIEQSGDNVEATVLRNENVAEFTFSDAEGEVTFEDDVEGVQPYIIDDAGTSVSIDNGDLDGDTGTVSVIAELDDGSSEVLRSFDYDFE